MIPYFYMDNFFFGFQAVVSESIDLIRRITAYKLFWGFSLGFLVSTILHGFLLTDHPKQLATMLLKDKAVSYQKLHTQDGSQKYKGESFQAYMKRVDKIKLVFLLAVILFVLLILFALLSW